MHSLILLMTLSAATAQQPAEKTKVRSAGLGIGVQTTLPGINAAGAGAIGPEAGISVVYDRVDWRIQTLLNVLFVEDNFTAFGIGGRFLYALHQMTMADFSVGAGLGFQFFDVPGDDNEAIGAYFEGLGQIRVFLVRNVAMNATLGIGFRVGDGPEAFGLTGQAHGSFGISYFF